ncbi:MAG TPA: hypothetical protein VJ508_09045, partial [Saprospiraceae bacterium]|nr:hypothetical protein [Saprospiraceae bacterium]
MITFVYLLLHLTIVTRARAERYDIVFGLNIVKNSLLAVIGAVIPGSSVTAFVAYAQRDYLLLGAITLGSVIFVYMVIFGLRRSNRAGLILLISLLGIISFLPFVFLRHISELYVYNSMAFVSIIVGIGLGALV